MNSFAVVVLLAAAAAAGPVSRVVYAPHGSPAGLAPHGLVRLEPVTLRSGYAPSPAPWANDEEVLYSEKFIASPSIAEFAPSPALLADSDEVVFSKKFAAGPAFTRFASPALLADTDEVVFSKKFAAAPAFTKFVKYAAPAHWADSDSIVYSKKFAAAPAFTKFIASPAFEPAVPARILSAEDEFPVPTSTLFKFAPAHGALHSSKFVDAPLAYDSDEVIPSGAAFPANKIVDTIPIPAKYALRPRRHLGPTGLEDPCIFLDCWK